MKTKENYKFEAKLFGLFQVFHLVKNQAYKLKLPKKQTIHDIFYVLLLEYNNTKKGLINEITNYIT